MENVNGVLGARWRNEMKKLYLLFFLLILFSFNVYALDCQYKDIKDFKQFELGLYDNEGNYVGTPLVFKDFNGGYLNLNGCTPPSFKIYNPLEFDIKLNLTYYISRSETSPGNPIFGELTIPSYSEIEIKGSCPDTGGWIIQNKSDYIITSPKILSIKNVEVLRQKEICKICPNGKQCLDDNTLCSMDNECGSSICNIAGYCGHEKLVICETYGKLNCKNQTCLMPSTKENGMTYSCEFECKSGYGKNNLCIINPKTTRNIALVFFVFLLLIVAIAAILIQRARGNKIAKSIINNAKGKEKEILSKAENKARGIIGEAEKKLGNIDNSIEDKKEQIKDLDKRLKSIKDDAKLSHKLKEKLIKTNEDIHELKLNKQKEINELLETYKERYGHEFVLDDGYIRFAKSWINPFDKGEYFHRWLFESHNNRKVKFGHEIHHKDFNKLNNDIDNLIEVTKEKHKELHLNRYNHK